MTWTAPDVTRIDEPFTGPERGILDGFLDWHRAALLRRAPDAPTVYRVGG
jgi:hypothetical protein